uniref:Uncharacterized protein n=1 Tax=Panulirus argus virus 1 TaxID=380624 RepID=A0A6G9HEH4_9VIRU|nr:hypothetical protein [Panulirus argus virus 1]
MNLDILKSVDINDLKKTEEYKDVDAIKLTEKQSFTDEEVKHVLFTVVMMRIAMIILDKLGLLHNPIMEQAKSYIKPGANKHEFFREVIKGVNQLRRKQRSIPLAKRKMVLDEITKFVAYQGLKNKRRKRNVIDDLIRRDGEGGRRRGY